MIRLSPSILSADFARLGAECQEVLKAGADMIHFDVMDGHFVHNISFGLPVLESIRKALPNAPQMEESVQVLGGHNPRFVFRQYG